MHPAWPNNIPTWADQFHSDSRYNLPSPLPTKPLPNTSLARAIHNRRKSYRGHHPREQRALPSTRRLGQHRITRPLPSRPLPTQPPPSSPHRSSKPQHLTSSKHRIRKPPPRNRHRTTAHSKPNRSKAPTASKPAIDTPAVDPAGNENAPLPPINWRQWNEIWASRMHASRRWVSAAYKASRIPWPVVRELGAYFGRDKFGPRRPAALLSREAMAVLKVMQEDGEGGLGSDLEWARGREREGRVPRWWGRVVGAFEEMEEEVGKGNAGWGVLGGEGEGDEGEGGERDGDGREGKEEWTVGESDLEDEWDDLVSDKGDGEKERWGDGEFAVD